MNIRLQILTFFIFFLGGNVLLFSQKSIELKNDTKHLNVIAFNNEVMCKMNIRSIHTEQMHKKELKPIIKDPFITSYYEFNDSGDLLMFYKTFVLYDTVYDTLVEFYTYNSNNQIKEFRRSEYGKYGVYEYVYQNDRVVELIQSEEENTNNSKIHLIPTNHKEKYRENYSYDNIDSLSYMKYTNSSDGIRFKEQEITYKNNKIKQEKTRYLYSKQKYNVFNYYYFENVLVKKEIIDNYSSKKSSYYIYRYDSDQRISVMETYEGEGEMQTILTEFLYRDDGLLDAIINKDIKTNTIEIIKYKYTFHSK